MNCVTANLILLLVSLSSSGCELNNFPDASQEEEYSGSALSLETPPSEDTLIPTRPEITLGLKSTNKRQKTPHIREHEVGGVMVLLEQIERGNGDTVYVRWHYTNKTANEKTLAGGTNQLQVPFLLTSGAYLIDTVNQKKYLVLRDASDTAIASEHGGPEWVNIWPGQTIDAWAKFPAPPKDVDVVSVYIPGLLTFENVQLIN